MALFFAACFYTFAIITGHAFEVGMSATTAIVTSGLYWAVFHREK